MTPSRRWQREGLIAGLIAYATVAVFYAAFDLLATRGALYTVNQLGRAVFRGVRDTAELGLPIALDPLAIFAYNALHLAASIGIGLVVAKFVDIAEERPMQAQVMLLWVLAGFAATILAIGAVTTTIRDVLPWWSIIVANSAAVVLAGAFMARQHPDFLSRMTVSPERK